MNFLQDNELGVWCSGTRASSFQRCYEKSPRNRSSGCNAHNESSAEAMRRSSHKRGVIESGQSQLR